MQNEKTLNGQQMLQARLRAKLGNPDAKKIASRKKWFYIFSVYSFILYFMHEVMFSIMFLPQMYFQGTQVEKEFFTTNFFVVQIMIVCSLAAFVSMICKRERLGAWLQTVAGLAALINMLQILFGEYINNSYMFVAYFIAWIGSLVAFSILLMFLKQDRQLKEAIQKEYEKIYKRYRTEDDTLFTEDQLEMILVAYETAMKQGIAVPKTLEEVEQMTCQEKDGE